MIHSNQFDDLRSKSLSVLTMQEFRILQIAKNGFCNKEIANQFNISIETVRKHRKNIMKKMGLRGKTEMTKFLIFLSIVS